MSVKSVLDVNSLKTTLKSAWSYEPEDRAYILFLFGFAAAMLGFYYLTFEADDFETVMVPRLTIYATLLLIVGAIFNAFFDLGEKITPDVDGDGNEDASFDTGSDGQFELTFTRLARKTGAMVAYILGVYYIGFYTITVAFSFAYIYLNTSATGKQRWINAVWITAAIFALLYAIFDIGLGIVTIYRLGFLP